MIVTDKYEGHTPGPWEAPHEILVSGLNHIGPLSNGQEEVNEVDAKLIADAPLLLEEVKRLKTRLFHAEKYLCGIEWKCYKDAIRFTLKEEITERMRSSD